MSRRRPIALRLNANEATLLRMALTVSGSMLFEGLRDPVSADATEKELENVAVMESDMQALRALHSRLLEVCRRHQAEPATDPNPERN